MVLWFVGLGRCVGIGCRNFFAAGYDTEFTPDTEGEETDFDEFAFRHGTIADESYAMLGEVGEFFRATEKHVIWAGTNDLRPAGCSGTGFPAAIKA